MQSKRDKRNKKAAAVIAWVMVAAIVGTTIFMAFYSALS